VLARDLGPQASLTIALGYVFMTIYLLTYLLIYLLNAVLTTSVIVISLSKAKRFNFRYSLLGIRTLSRISGSSLASLTLACSTRSAVEEIGGPCATSAISCR
jgi:hypothetical protein